MGKKNKEISKEDFNRGLQSQFYGPGAEARKLLDRYGVAGTRSVKPDNRGSEPPGREHRELSAVKKDLAAAMMNDYDTRRGMEAAALAGNKDARKFAEEGYRPTAKSLSSAWSVMRDLKKEHVGGGGMSGPENEAGLTMALVDHERDVFNQSIDDRIADAIPKEAPVAETKPDPEADKPSDHLAAAQELVDVYKGDIINNYLDHYKPNASEESIEALRNRYGKGTYARQLKGDAPSVSSSDKGSTASDFANVYKENVKGSLKPA